MTDARNLEGTGVLLLEGGAFRALESYVPAGGGTWTDSTFVNINSGGDYWTFGQYGTDTWDPAVPSGIMEHYGFGTMTSIRQAANVSGADQYVKLTVPDTHTQWVLVFRASSTVGTEWNKNGYTIRYQGPQYVIFYDATGAQWNFNEPVVPSGPGTVEGRCVGTVVTIYVNGTQISQCDYAGSPSTGNYVGFGSSNQTVITLAEGSGGSAPTSWQYDFATYPDGEPAGWTTIAGLEVEPATVHSGVYRTWPRIDWRSTVRPNATLSTRNVYAKGEYIFIENIGRIHIGVLNADNTQQSGIELHTDGSTIFYQFGGGSGVGTWTPPALGVPFIIDFAWNNKAITCSLNGTVIASNPSWADVVPPVYISTYIQGGMGLRKWSSGDVAAGSATAPGQVTGLTVGTVATTSVALSWTAPSNGGSAITDYLVEYGNGTTWTAFSHAASTTTSITVTGLTAATPYSFRVSAINAVGTGTASTSVTATTTGGGSGPASTYAKATGTSCTINKPACSVGDVLVWFMGNTAQQPVANYQTPDASAGTWALQGAGTTDGGAGYSANVSVYTRVVTGTEASTFQANAPAGYSQEQSLAMVAVANAVPTLAALSFAGAPHSTGPLNLPGVAVPTGGVGLVFVVSYPGFGDANAPASGPWLTLIEWNPGVLLQFTGTGTSPTAVIPFGGGDTQGVQIAVASGGGGSTFPFVDDFERADGPAGANYEILEGDLTIVSGALKGTGYGGTYGSAKLVAVPPSADQYVQFVSPVPTATGGVDAFLRQTGTLASNSNAYVVWWYWDGAALFQVGFSAFANGADAGVGAVFTPAFPSAQFTVRGEIIGTTWRLFLNGTQLGTGTVTNYAAANRMALDAYDNGRYNSIEFGLI